MQAKYVDDSVGGLVDNRVGDVLDPDVAGLVDDGCSHVPSPRRFPAPRQCLSDEVLAVPPSPGAARVPWGMTTMDLRSEIREFLSSRRARITPEQAGLPAYGGNRRVKGLRREEVAMLAGVSVDYYVRMERGSLAGASESVLDALASALQLDEAERDHLYALARESGTGTRRRTRRTPGDRSTGAPAGARCHHRRPAWIRNGRHDVLAMNQLAARCTRRCSPILAGRRTPPGSST